MLLKHGRFRKTHTRANRAKRIYHDTLVVLISNKAEGKKFGKCLAVYEQVSINLRNFNCEFFSFENSLLEREDIALQLSILAIAAIRRIFFCLKRLEILQLV